MVTLLVVRLLQYVSLSADWPIKLAMETIKFAIRLHAQFQSIYPGFLLPLNCFIMGTTPKILPSFTTEISLFLPIGEKLIVCEI